MTHYNKPSVNVDIDISAIEHIILQYFENIDDVTPIMEEVLPYFTEAELLKIKKMINNILHKEYGC